MRGLIHHSLVLAIIGLLAVVLATGPAVRPVPTDMDLRLEGWLLSGGSTQGLCGDRDTGGGGDGHCPMCTLTALAGPPPVPVSLVDIDQRILARIVLPQMRRAVAHARDPALPNRGPPPVTHGPRRAA